MKKIILMLLLSFIAGCSFSVQLTRGQDYDTFSVVNTYANEVELKEFWEKIDGEMRPESIWGDAKTDQEKCQAEADYMAKFNKFCHVGPCIGRFEGIGWSRSGKMPGTCTPRYRMCLTGDATATCDDGTVIRVRSWR